MAWGADVVVGDDGHLVSTVKEPATGRKNIGGVSHHPVGFAAVAASHYSGSGSATVLDEAGSATGGVEDAGSGGVGGFVRSPRRDPGRVLPCTSGLAP